MEECRSRPAARRARNPPAPRPSLDGAWRLTRVPPLDDRALLARLVGFDTTSSASNLPLAEFLADYLDRPGVRVAWNRSPDGAKANLLVSIGPERDDRSGVVLSGHTDVVPAREAEWRADPFTLWQEEDRLYGRGTADMKGFLALAANRFAAVPPQLVRHPLVLLFTYDEEVGTLGARHFSESWPGLGELPRDVVIGEPTGLRVVHAHKGMLRLRLVFNGRAAHSGYPHLGRSAIEPAARAIVALTELGRSLETERPAAGAHFPDVPFATLNVGTVQGGSAANVIPDRCEVELGIRLLPGMSPDGMTARVHDAVQAAAGSGPFTLETTSLSPAMITPETAAIHRELCLDIGQHETHTVLFASDAGWLQRAGFHCVLFGPGSIEVAHRPNEFVPVGELGRAGELLDALVRRRCLAA